MTLNLRLLRTAAFAALALFTPVILMGPSGPVASAQAAVDVSINFGTFYDRLANSGDWTNYQGAYVFVPRNMHAGWRPYTLGHWAFTSDYGWLWISDEPFGWATYHYGRWGNDARIGWYWIPGKRWAPAWVSWRRSNDNIVWAPLPPGVDDNLSVNISINAIPDNYWIAVPARRFADTNLSLVIVTDDRERRRIVDQTQSAGNVIVRNNIVVNTAIDVTVVEKLTGAPVKRLTVKRSDRPGDNTVQANEVSVFTGDAVESGDKKPPKVTDLKAIKKIDAQPKVDVLPKVDAQPKDTIVQKGKVDSNPANAAKSIKLGKPAAGVLTGNSAVKAKNGVKSTDGLGKPAAKSKAKLTPMTKQTLPGNAADKVKQTPSPDTTIKQAPAAKKTVNKTACDPAKDPNCQPSPQ